MFGYSGTTNTAEKCRKECYDENKFLTLTNGASTLLNLISTNNGLPPISTSISQEEFVKGFKKCLERTSTSKSGQHLGHYKCLFADDEYLGYTEEEPDPSEQILGVIAIGMGY
jgi:hypothetical protein